MNTETFASCLAARNYAYTVFHALLGDEPAAERLKAIDTELCAQSFEMIGAERPNPLLSLLSTAAKETDLHRQYMRCFVGPHKLPVPLWEAATRTGEDALFQEITLNVRKAYRSVGFLPAEYPHVPDDHIALELDFMRALAARAQEAEDEKACLDDLSVSLRFLENHLGVWAGTFAKRLRASDASDFYATVAEAVEEFAQADEKWLSEALA